MTPINKPFGRDALLLYAPDDQVYYNHLKRHLQFALAERPIGNIHYLGLENSAPFRASLEQRTERTAALVCLISHHFLTADFGYSLQLNRLLRAHRMQQLRLIPVFLDNCSLRVSPLAKLRRLPSNRSAVNEMAVRPDFHELLAALVDDILQEITAITDHHDAVWRAWRQAAATNTAAAFQAFFQRHPGSRLAGVARAKYEELTERDLWAAALHADGPPAWSNYLRKSPRNEHKRKAILRLVAAERREAVARQDAEASDNPGVLLDYLTRFPTEDRSDRVDRRARYDVSHQRADWENAIAPLRTNADYLGQQICTLCTPREIGTYRLLERSFGTAQINAERLRKKLLEWHEEVMIWGITLGLIIGLLVVIAVFAGMGIGDWAGHHPFVLAGAFGCVVFCFWAVRSGIRSDAASCKSLYGKLVRELIELKVAFLNRDATRLRKVSAELYRAAAQLREIGLKKRWDYWRIVERREAPKSTIDA